MKRNPQPLALYAVLVEYTDEDTQERKEATAHALAFSHEAAESLAVLLIDEYSYFGSPLVKQTEYVGAYHGPIVYEEIVYPDELDTVQDSVRVPLIPPLPFWTLIGHTLGWVLLITLGLFAIVVFVFLGGN